ncbi:hypothetical protein E5288_WYG007324 [Bos mutus]|uniref:BHLH domain-containing protein n=1 Tax=Bos mutus TaxID=72004 RepID=A0A6B0RWQ1_9CETA|nr:hypothetical protein [Bos mutus]
MVTFHLYPEGPVPSPYSENLPLLPFSSDSLIMENYGEPCAFSFPMPYPNYRRCEYSYGPAFIRKRNERERQRVKCVNEGYAQLRHHLPEEYLEKRLSKVETLRAAIKYINYLQSLLCFREVYGLLRAAWDAFAQILQRGHDPEGPCLGRHCSSLGPLLHLPPRLQSTLADPAQPPHQLERQGVLLVEFEAPLATGPELPAQRQSVVLEEDVIQFSPTMEFSLRPGDKVLAPWGPDQQRYGPGTVLLGLEAGDLQRASPKEEEITVHFWNGRTAPVPLRGVQWVPPAVWKKAVDGLHKPFARQHPRPLLWAPCCSLVGPVTGFVTSGLPLSPPFLTSGVAAREPPEAELKPTAQLLPLENPEEEEVAVQAPAAVSSSSTSSSSEDEDLENELEMGPPQRLLVDSTVNTDPILLEKSPRKQGGLCQPEWRYWRRNGPEPYPGKPGIRLCSTQKDEKSNRQQREKPAAAGSPRELALNVTGMKPLQILPKEAGHRKLSQGTAAHQQGQNSETKSPKDQGS